MGTQRIFVRGVWEQLYEVEAKTPKEAYEKFCEDPHSDDIIEIEDKHYYVCDITDKDILKLKPYRVEK